MTTFLRDLPNDEPPIDPDDTQPIPPPIFPLAGMGVMITLIGPDGKEHWVRKGSYIHRLMREHGYRIGGQS